jgi:hypothetical protein
LLNLINVLKKNFELESFKATSYKPFLTANNRKGRLEWRKDRDNWSYEKWATVIFSDKSHFQLDNRKNKQLIRRF